MIQGGGLAAVAITFAQYLLRLAGRGRRSAAVRDPRADPRVALVNIAGVKPGSRLLERPRHAQDRRARRAPIFGGLFLAARRRPAAARRAAVPRPGASLLAFGAALVPILFSYGGWQSANTLAEEIREPRRTLPRALFAGTLIVLAVYVLGQRRLPRDARPRRPRRDRDARGRRRAAPLRGAARIAGSPPPIAVSTFGFLDLTLLGPTRIYYAMARDGVFLPGLSSPASAVRNAAPRDPPAGALGRAPDVDGHLRRARRFGRLRGLDLLRA